MIADRVAKAVLHVRVRYGLAELVTVLMIVRHADGTQYNCGLASMPLEDWHETVRPLYVAGVERGTVTLDDDTLPKGRAR